jgi:hypothetical protein
MWGEKSETAHDGFSGKNFKEELARVKRSVFQGNFPHG